MTFAECAVGSGAEIANLSFSEVKIKTAEKPREVVQRHVALGTESLFEVLEQERKRFDLRHSTGFPSSGILNLRPFWLTTT